MAFYCSKSCGAMAFYKTCRYGADVIIVYVNQLILYFFDKSAPQLSEQQ
jgi:hypothetical protein